MERMARRRFRYRGRRTAGSVGTIIMVIVIGLVGFIAASTLGGKKSSSRRSGRRVVQPPPAIEVPTPAPTPAPEPQPRSQPKPRPTPPPPEPKPRYEEPEPEEVGYSANQGAVMFICNDTSHGDMEVLIRRCPTCAKRDRFAVDTEAKCFRCRICSTELTEYVCDTCGKKAPPGKKIRLKPHVGR
jgi:hypothetical protein